MLQITISKRAALIIGIALLMVIPAVAGATHIFTDVIDGSTHAPGIEWVADNGVSTGCGDGSTYCPNDSVSRAQMGTFMCRLSGNCGVAPSVNAATLDGMDSTDFLGVGDQAADADTLDGLDGEDYLTDDPITIIEAGGWNYNTGVGGGAIIEEYNSRTRLEATGASTYWGQLKLTAPSSLGGDSWGLSSIEICYAAGGGAMITDTMVRDRSGGVVIDVIDDETDRSSTSEECYTNSLLFADAIEQLANLQLHISAASSGDFIDVFSVRTTWSQPLVLIPLGTTDSTEGEPE